MRPCRASRAPHAQPWPRRCSRSGPCRLLRARGVLARRGIQAAVDVLEVGEEGLQRCVISSAQLFWLVRGLAAAMLGGVSVGRWMESSFSWCGDWTEEWTGSGQRSEVWLMQSWLGVRCGSRRRKATALQGGELYSFRRDGHAREPTGGKDLSRGLPACTASSPALERPAEMSANLVGWCVCFGRETMIPCS